MTDERYKQIMTDLGMPNSRSLLMALQQVANEAAQEAIAQVVRVGATGYQPLRMDGAIQPPPKKP